VLDDKAYVFSFDDEMLERKRRAADDVLFVDMREYGNLMRLLNDEQDDPPLRLFYWPPPPRHVVEDAERASTAQLPRRIFLMAARKIPPLTELTWDYGEEYYRPWLAHDGARVGGDADDSCTDSEAEWAEENWVQCDRCDKWRRLPSGPEFCDAALPDTWYCEMNPNTRRNTCAKPEERMDPDEIWDMCEGGEEAASDEVEEIESDEVEEVEEVDDDADGEGRLQLQRAKPQVEPPGVTCVSSFLANQSDSSDSEDTRLAKRARRAQLRLKARARKTQDQESAEAAPLGAHSAPRRGGVIFVD